jgi:hypothetical protein
MEQRSGSKAADAKFAGPPKKFSPGRMSNRYWYLYYKAQNEGLSGSCAWCKKPSKHLVKHRGKKFHPACTFKYDKNQKYIKRLPGK